MPDSPGARARMARACSRPSKAGLEGLVDEAVTLDPALAPKASDTI